MKIRNWCFTSFEEEVPVYSMKHMRYMVCQKEKCPQSGKIHWQGYVEFSEGQCMKAVKTIFGIKGLHLEPRKGTQQQAIDYCKKTESRVDGSVIEIGESKKQGSRSDLNSIWEACESGATKLELLREFKGNAFRHLGMIDRAQKAVFGLDNMDNYITRFRRELAEFETLVKTYKTTPTEVTGNTIPSLEKYKYSHDSDSDQDSCTVVA